MRTSRKQVGCSLLWSFLCAFLLVHGASAENEHDADQRNDRWAVKAGRNALQGSNNYPWYDAEEDDLRPLELEPPTLPPETRDWELTLPQWRPPQRNWSSKISFWEGIQWFVWAFLVVFLVGSMGMLIRVHWKRDRFAGRFSTASTREAVARDAESIENLPFPVERRQADLLEEARRNYELDNFGKATMYLFSYQLVYLDKHQLIRLAKGKTNRQYLRELRKPDGNVDRQSLLAVLHHTMTACEEFFFGNHAIEKIRFESCWQRMDEFHKTVQRLMIAILLVMMIGCRAGPPIESTYGRLAGKPGGPSVNGTGVLADMFEQAGYQVLTSRYLGRLVQKAPLVVWFPDDHDLPSNDVHDFFADWLNQEDDRTLVYVGRDFNAEISYWLAMQSRANADDAVEYRRRAAHAQSVWDSTMSGLSPTDECRWFAIDRSAPPRRVDSLEGLWSDEINVSQTNVWLHSRLVLAGEDITNSGWQVTPLLSSEGDVLAAEILRYNGSRVIAVSNGSWLLNLPLVNHEHRKLAGRLIERCGSPGQVVFVESGESGLKIADKDQRKPYGLVVFTEDAWPLNLILRHLTVLGILYCFAVFPIFGPPKRLPGRDNSDFGRHISALGDLLAKTDDLQFARMQVAQYHQMAGDGVAAEDVSVGPATGIPFAEQERRARTSSRSLG